MISLNAYYSFVHHGTGTNTRYTGSEILHVMEIMQYEVSKMDYTKYDVYKLNVLTL